MNPENPKEFKLLVNAVLESRRKLGVFRENRSDLISMFVGSEYSDNAEAKKTYLDLFALAANIYVRQLAVRAPTAKVTTAFDELRPLAANLTLACQDAAQETELGLVLRRAAMEALFSPLACVKLGIELVGTAQEGDEEVDLTDPFVKLVSFDDYVRDMSARSAYDPAYEGDRYFITKEEFIKRFPKNAKDVTAQDMGMQDENGIDRTENISHAPFAGDEELGGKVELQDIWLKDERLLITYLTSKPGDKPLRVLKYDTVEEGPYRSLWFTDVPDNAMPLPPFSLLKNIHNLANSLFRRLASQAQKRKSVPGFSSDESAQRFNAAIDGNAIFWDGQKPEMIETGGIDQPTLALFLQVKDVFSWAGGNLDSLGGLSPMSETAKQDELLSQSASAQLADMQDAMTVFAQSVFRQIAWYEWTDPVRTRILQKKIRGTEIAIPIEWSPETRQGDFLDFNFKIIPQSMRDDAPGVKINKIQTIMNQVVAPYMELMQQQGLTIDMKKLFTMIADYSNVPELEGIIVSMDPNAQQQQMPKGNPNPVGKPAETTRNYVRTNRAGATRVGKEAALIQNLMGNKVQASEAAAINRSVS